MKTPVLMLDSDCVDLLGAERIAWRAQTEIVRGHFSSHESKGVSKLVGQVCRFVQI